MTLQQPTFDITVCFNCFQERESNVSRVDKLVREPRARDECSRPPKHVPCESFVSNEDQCFIVMPFVDGSDLQRIVSYRTFESQQLICIVQSVAMALDDAQGGGLVHGNLHPRHILVDNIDHVWLIGFAEFGSVDCSEFRFGNPHHFASEQLECNLTTPAADIYALAEVCYLCLCGSYPFANCGGIESVMECKQKGRIPRIRERRPDLSQRVDDILQRGMAISPTERYSSAGEFAKELSVALGSKPGKRWWRAYSLLR